jgi:DNA-binding CsgD family transcriptional regulator/tetratricopeptide (TPR) repeat protein
MTLVLCPVLVGRTRERDDLLALLDAGGDRGTCAVLSGQPGIGKSRLTREVATEARARGWTVLSGRAVPATSTDPFRPLTEVLLQALAGGPMPDEPLLAPWVAALGGLVPGGAGGAPLESVAPAVLGEAWLRVVCHLAPGGALVVLEDLHWADLDTLAVLEYLGDNTARRPVVLLLTMRDEPVTPALDWARRQRGRPTMRHIPLAELGDDDMAALVDACAPGLDAGRRRQVLAAAEGVPLLAEELLGSSGIPDSLADSVVARLAQFPPDQRAVLDAAAVLGRHFPWELLGAIADAPDAVVSAALAGGIETSLLVADGSELRFRHALIREAALVAVLPPCRRALALRALRVLEERHPGLPGGWSGVAAELAVHAGEQAAAARLLVRAGAASLERGALATAAANLEEALSLHGDADLHRAAGLLLLRTLSLAGRVDEALAVGGRLHAAADASPPEALAEIHARVAEAAVAGSRWSVAEEHLARAEACLADAPAAELRVEVQVLRAECALAADDVVGAREVAHAVAADTGVSPDARCHAWEIVGRCLRLGDTAGARQAFEQAFAIAEAAALPLWRLRALHEIGTIDLFEHAGVARLLEARRAAEATGALSTAAILDVQLAAGYTCRWELDAADHHGRRAAELADRLNLPAVHSKALALLGGTASMRGDREATTRLFAEARAAMPGDGVVHGLALAHEGLRRLLAGDIEAAREPWERGIVLLDRLPRADPAAVRALWPLFLAASGDPAAGDAIAGARRRGVSSIRLNAGLIDYASAILAGRAGRAGGAEHLVGAADAAFVNCGTWQRLAEVLCASAAIADGWGSPRRWLDTASDPEIWPDVATLAAVVRERLGYELVTPWPDAGITRREAEVLALVSDGLANKEIAARLRCSPRTVEKHVESLLRKTGVRSRTELAVAATRAVAPGT